MKTKIVLTACVLLVSSSAYAADLPIDETPQLQFQSEAATQYQARVDSDDTPALLQAMQRYRFRHENTLLVRNMIQDAQQQGLPTTPVMDKVYEGIAKKVNEDMIVQAVKRVSERYENAYRQANLLITDKQQARRMGQIIAEAYTAGVKEEDCAKIMTKLQNRARTINQEEARELMVQTMVAARTMARRGVKSITISDVLTNALEQSYQAREMQTLQHSFIQQLRYESPEDAASNFLVDISRGSQASELGAQSSINASGSSRSSSVSNGSSGPGSSNGSGSSSSSSGSNGSSGSASSNGSNGYGGSNGANGSSGSRGSDRR